MSLVRDGFSASEGIVSGKIRLVHWSVPEVPHDPLDPGKVQDELDRFERARVLEKDRLMVLKEETAARLGPVEARIFDPQILMLDDVEVVDGTVRYVRHNRLTAARAFQWRMLELRDRWAKTRNPMVLDRLNDLEDLEMRLLLTLMGKEDPLDLSKLEEPVIIIARNLTPSITARMDPEKVLGIGTDLGTRTAHWVMLARSLSIPAVVGLGDLSKHVTDGQTAILDGRIGRVVVNPDEKDEATFEQRAKQFELWLEEIEVIAGLEAVSKDGHPITIRGNIDLPSEAERAHEYGASGVGLFRTEFLVVGRNSMPGEEEQYQAYRGVAEAFPSETVFIRTFDLGGDKFPTFLHMPAEENPFLGWRAIRVCLDEPDLFRTQLRALLRATAHGDVRIMLPLVNDVEEICAVRSLLGEEEVKLRDEGIPFNAGYKVGVLIETPAAALNAAELAQHSDFFSIGTNDLVQYTLAVDRTNTRLAHLYNPFHPSVVRQLHHVSKVARTAGIEVSVCGELAANPLGAFLLLGLDIAALSVAWPSLPEIKKAIREFRVDHARTAARKALAAPTSDEVIKALVEGIGDSLDLAAFSGRWNLSLKR